MIRKKIWVMIIALCAVPWVLYASDALYLDLTLPPEEGEVVESIVGLDEDPTSGAFSPSEKDETFSDNESSNASDLQDISPDADTDSKSEGSPELDDFLYTQNFQNAVDAIAGYDEFEVVPLSRWARLKQDVQQMYQRKFGTDEQRMQLYKEDMLACQARGDVRGMQKAAAVVAQFQKLFALQAQLQTYKHDPHYIRCKEFSERCSNFAVLTDSWWRNDAELARENVRANLVEIYDCAVAYRLISASCSMDDVCCMQKKIEEAQLIADEHVSFVTEIEKKIKEMRRVLLFV